MIHNNFCIF